MSENTLMEIKEDRIQLVGDAIAFMSSLARHYGSEKGMEIWERMSDICDPTFKSEVFMAMLTGFHGDRILLRGISEDANAVTCIKAIRSLDTRSLGLKEAKDIYDGLRHSNKTATLEIRSSMRRAAVNELRSIGFEI